jgi:hypothetical protein
MTSHTPAYRVQRALRPEELQSILERISAATDTHALFIATVYGALGPLLADDGIAVADLGPDRKANPSHYAIPTSQWQAIVGAATDRAAAWGTGVHLGFAFANVMPMFYDDPDGSAPEVPRRDYRPLMHELHVSREACDVIAACEAHIQALREYYGTDSQTYQQAADSWHYQLAQLFSMSFGADTHIRRDDDLSLIVTTGGGTIYGLIFHAHRRHCMAETCSARIRDDATAYPSYLGAPVAEHDHIPSYPLNAPQPGIWSFHS